MQKLFQILSPEGMLRVQVPNDFSALQKEALKSGRIADSFWIAPHEHMSYFNKESLENVFRSVGFREVESLGDFPIDFNLFNDQANYVVEPKSGKACHWQRIRIDNLLAQQGPQNLVAFRRGCGQAGLGRNIIVYGSK